LVFQVILLTERVGAGSLDSDASAAPPRGAVWVEVHLVRTRWRRCGLSRQQVGDRASNGRVSAPSWRRSVGALVW